ncbi:MAG: type II toxin-antitoxin system HigB family toxin [Sphaerospermopsis kisseleviana]|uniref:type II toxin-antitoxin system HigB family toxin n=1 Tax=unclassified Sphaerospermopsis TaxID=2646443 RepID=UPI00164D6B40|nr:MULTISPECIES: type II toxin-antitoxin system HigB family toxin [unclassified Sphaerospermopsis]MBC5794515.1 type II toxin-antitoxin system HigB family toxin [Sphaerospermopsis sp. LEGE 00249]MBD2146491.1 type II toxin-antitoxin system HigB family toxin [Sphaerospermopsis sp. FACHB-1194]
MHLISIRTLRNDAAKYPDIKKQIEDWNTTVKKAEWQNLEDVRKVYRDTEAVGNFTVFNIKGNDYRLIVGINYATQKVFYKYLLTHAEYSKEKWKNDDYF